MTLVGAGWKGVETADKLKVIVGGNKECTGITMSEDWTTIECEVPSGIGRNVPVIVTAVGTGFQAETTLSYQEPIIVNASSTEPGGITKITGMNFGDEEGTVRVVIGGVLCSEVMITAPHTEHH